MSPEQCKRLLPIITAFSEGKVIQLETPSGVWKDTVKLEFSCSPEKYRIKPAEPLVLWGVKFFDLQGRICIASNMELTEFAALEYGRRVFGNDFVETVRLGEV